MSTFLRRRSRRLLAYTLIFGVAALLMAMREGETSLWSPLLSGFEYALAENGGNASFEALKYFALVDLAPFMIALSVMALAAFIIAFILVTFVLTAIPLRFQAYLDGVVAMAGLILLFEASGLATPLRETFGGVGTIVFYWVLMFSTSALVWNRLPFGLRYQSATSRVVPLALGDIADRLVPGRDPEKELADIAMVNRRPGIGEAEIMLRVEPEQPDGQMSFDLYCEGNGHFVRTQNMHFDLVQTASNETSVTIDVTLTGLSPMSYWDFWNRPFTEDYADHILARLTGAKDRSTYGRMQSAVRRKQDKKALKQAHA